MINLKNYNLYLSDITDLAHLFIVKNKASCFVFFLEAYVIDPAKMIRQVQIFPDGSTCGIPTVWPATKQASRSLRVVYVSDHMNGCSYYLLIVALWLVFVDLCNLMQHLPRG